MARKKIEVLSERDIVLSEQLKFDIQYAIVKVMREKGISRSQLAERMKATPSRITKLLGENENLTIETIARVCAALEDEPVFTTKFLHENDGKLKYQPRGKAPNGWADTLHAEYAIEARSSNWTHKLFESSINVQITATQKSNDTSMMHGFMELAKKHYGRLEIGPANHNERQQPRFKVA